MPPNSKRCAYSISCRETSLRNRLQKRTDHLTADVPDAGGQPALREPGPQPDHGVQDPQHPNAPGNNRAVLTCHSWASVYSLLTPTINPTACCPQAPMSSSMMQTWPTTASVKRQPTCRGKRPGGKMPQLRKHAWMNGMPRHPPYGETSVAARCAASALWEPWISASSDCSRHHRQRMGS